MATRRTIRLFTGNLGTRTNLKQGAVPHRSTAPQPVSTGFRLLESRGAADQAEAESQQIVLDMLTRTKEDGRLVCLESTGNRELLDVCKNSYLGLSSHPEVVQAGIEALKKYGSGIGCVRAGHGTFPIHLAIEKAFVEFHDRDPEEWGVILLPSGYQANVGFFAEFCSADDVIISDELVHGCAIDGIRLSNAHRARYRNNNMEDLEKKLREHMDKRMRIIATDGVFSMDGTTAPLKEIKELAVKYNATVYVDDSHGLGLVGQRGRGTEDYTDAIGAADVIASSVCKGLTPQGGYILAPKKCTEVMRYRNRPYIFSTTLSPAASACLLKALEICVSEEGDVLRANIKRLAKRFRSKMKKHGFIVYGEDEIPICPVVFPSRDGKNLSPMCIQFARKMIENDVLVIAVTIPSAPPDLPRIRNIISGHHTEEDIDRCVDVYAKVGKEFGVIN